NALQYASIPCLFAMAQAIGGERFQNTLSAILVSPAPRIPLFFGRSLPVVLNGAFVAAFALLTGSIVLRVHLPASSLAPRLLVVLIAALSCTGLGLVNAALSLRIRENAVLSNVIFGFLLIFTGANVPLDDLPNWMSTLAQGLPFTHAIKAARELVAGASLGDVAGLLGGELLVGAVYGVPAEALRRHVAPRRRRLRDPRLRAAALVRDAQPPARLAGALLMRARDLNWLQVEEYLSRDDRVVLPIGSPPPTRHRAPT